MMPNRLTRRIFTGGLASVAATWPLTRALAAFEQKQALLIGNLGYTPAVGRLKNTLNDVDLIARALRAQSFESAKIFQAKDVKTAGEIIAAVDGYLERLRRAGLGALGFFYYCGHGVADPVNRRNYLIPTGVATAATPQLWTASVETATLFERLARHTGPQIVVLDCCRSELNLGTNTAPMPATSPATVAAARPSTRPQGRGLVAVATHRRANMFICHAASEGEPALDFVGTDKNGPFAKALSTMLRYLPQRTTHDIFKQTQLRVREATNDVQNPAMLDDLDAAASGAKMFGNSSTEKSRELVPASRKDFALVVANSHIGTRLALPRARRDGERVALALQDCGYDAELALDLTRDAFFAKLAALKAKMRAGEGAASAVLFFTGYGAGRHKGFVNGEETRENFLIPNGVTPERLDDITEATCIAMTKVVATLVDTPARSIAILKDANRWLSNAITPKGNHDWGSLGRKLEQQHRNLLIVHAAQPDKTSTDDAQGSVFARVVAERLKRPERRTVQQVMNDVVAGVFEQTQGQQKPWFDPANDIPMFFADESALGRRQG